MLIHRAYKIILPICATLILSGCTFNLFGSKSAAEKSPKELQKQTMKLHDDPKPLPDPELIEYEKRAVSLTKKNVLEAKDATTEAVVINKLGTAEDLLSALERSIGTPSQEIDNTLSNVKSVIKTIDRENEKFKKAELVYEKKMDENRQTIAKLQGMVNTKIESEKSLLDQVKFWFWIVVILSVAIAVFVPGGMLIVKRVWSKVAEMAWSGAQSGAEAMGEMSKAISDYLASVDKQESEKFLKYLGGMPEAAKEYWSAIRKGQNPLLQNLANAPDSIKKSLNGKS